MSNLVVPARISAPAPSGSLGLSVLVTTVASDSHTWNLVFLSLALQELGHRVRNLGPCTPVEEVIAQSLVERPDVLVVSSVNGHGLRDGANLIAAVRGVPELMSVPAVIGGKLGIQGSLGHRHRTGLLQAGFDAVFSDNDGPAALRGLRELVRTGRQV